ncbi:MAG: hypothetical protein ACO38Y_05890 [Steroidobacteraceae bacterium]
MQVTVLNCKGCGSNLDFVAGVPSAECPYCGQTMVIQDTRAEAVSFNAMIPIRLDRQQFQEKTLEFLAAGEFTPDDLLINYEVKEDLHAVYAPFYRHKLSFDGAMTCDAGREEIHYVRVKVGNEYVNQKRTEIAWEPFQRNLKGRRTLDVCLAQRIDEELLRNLQSATEDQSLSKFSPELVRDHAIEHAIEQVESDEVFMSRGYPRLKAHVHRLATESAPTHHRNIKVSFDYEVEDKTPFLSGVWLQTYGYGERTYQVVMDAGSGQVFGYRPEDEDRRNWQAEIKKLGHMSWLPGIANGLLALAFGKALWVAAAVLGIGYYLSNSLGKRVSENSRRFRQELLEAFKAGGREADVTALKSRAEVEYNSIRERQAFVPKLYAGSVALSLVLWGGFAATEWITSADTGRDYAVDEATVYAVAADESAYQAEPVPVSTTTEAATSSDLHVVITNNTGYPVQQVFISPDDAASWEEDLLAGRILSDGEGMTFTLKGYSNPIFDIKLVDTDGDTYSFHDVDVERYDVTATIANLDR